MKINRRLSRLFLLSLALLALVQIFSAPIFGFDIKTIPFLSTFYLQLSTVQYGIMIFAIILGALLFYVNKDNVESIEEEQNRELRLEDQRKVAFKSRFPRISKIPVLRSIVKGLYKEGRWYCLGLSIIVLLFGFLFSINLGKINLEDDEFYTINVAYNLQKSSELYQYDRINNLPGQESEYCMKNVAYCHYTRAWIYTYIVKDIYDVFGVSEFSTRLAGAILGILSVLLLYFGLKSIGYSKKLALFISILFISSSIVFSNFFTARMYSLLMFISILTFVLSFKYYYFIKSIKKFDGLNLLKLLLFSVALIIVVYIGYNTQIEYLLLVGLIALYFVIINLKAIISNIYGFIKKNKNVSIMIALILLVIFGYLIFNSGVIEKYSIFFTYRDNISYYSRYFYYILYSGLGNGLGSNLIIREFYFYLTTTLLLIALSLKLKGKWSLYGLPIFITISSMILYLFFISTNLFVLDRYVCHINILGIISLGIGVYLVYTILRSYYKYIYVFIIFVIVVNTIYGLVDAEYKKGEIYPNYALAYDKIINNFDKNNDIVLGHPLRTLYFKGINADMDNFGSASLMSTNYDLNMFKEDLKLYSGKNIYFTYSLIKGFHIDKRIVDYITNNYNYIKLSGSGVDNTNVEVYYFNTSMIKQQ